MRGWGAPKLTPGYTGHTCNFGVSHDELPGTGLLAGLPGALGRRLRPVEAGDPGSHHGHPRPRRRRSLNAHGAPAPAGGAVVLRAGLGDALGREHSNGHVPGERHLRRGHVHPGTQLRPLVVVACGLRHGGVFLRDAASVRPVLDLRRHAHRECLRRGFFSAPLRHLRGGHRGNGRMGLRSWLK